ncbi:hypothetical protein B9Z19DRAFT_1100051 [Tuber borchii]|uniref:Phosphoribosylaminoimidazole-succinocarboxamide synthase n=1 Tax=Tuber borchii TaxID=42251 RepID=A0A2T6ZZL2_TUBBO|nr:hypothetical protein B9Z19DRAFT_1100051 [Tuber borchii]
MAYYHPLKGWPDCTDLKGALPLLAKGKFRDVYTLSPDTLLVVATDRIFAYDVTMKNGIPNKGKFLTARSEFWLTTVLKDVGPNHFKFSAQLKGRSMVVKKLNVFPVEAIVRGYLTGSAWVEYQDYGTVHGIQVPQGMEECQAFEKPLFTPSTKAAQGQHDENIHPDKVAQLVGHEYAKKIEEFSLALYTKARDYAAGRGIIIADTKFEFGLDKDKNVVLVDGVLTPGSSRFWLASACKAGRSQDSYDKQSLRDWLTKYKLKGRHGVVLPDKVILEMGNKYHEAYELLARREWKEV